MNTEDENSKNLPPSGWEEEAIQEFYKADYELSKGFYDIELNRRTHLLDKLKVIVTIIGLFAGPGIFSAKQILDLIYETLFFCPVLYWLIVGDYFLFVLLISVAVFVSFNAMKTQFFHAAPEPDKFRYTHVRTANGFDSIASTKEEIRVNLANDYKRAAQENFKINEEGSKKYNLCLNMLIASFICILVLIVFITSMHFAKHFRI